MNPNAQESARWSRQEVRKQRLGMISLSKLVRLLRPLCINEEFDQCPRINNTGAFPLMREMAGVAGYQVVSLGILRTFQKAVVAFVLGNSESLRRLDSNPDAADQGEGFADDVDR